MGDIVERLRAAGVSDALMIGDVWRLCTDAADEIQRLRKDMEFYRNFAAEVLAVKRLPMPHDMEALCRTAYDNRYHKVKADMSYDNWRLVWIRAIASHEAAPPAQQGEQRLSYSVLALNAAWNARKPESDIADAIDLCRRLTATPTAPKG